MKLEIREGEKATDLRQRELMTGENPRNGTRDSELPPNSASEVEVGFQPNERDQ